MKELNNKSVENVIWFLGELAAGGSELIESDDFEVECDGGSSRTVSIAGLAEDAAAIIAKQANLISEFNKLVDMNADEAIDRLIELVTRQ